MDTTLYTIEPIEWVRSELTQLEIAPLQGDDAVFL
jgi:hypothetical protein